MRTMQKKNPQQKRRYAKPRLERVQVDNKISINMDSVPPYDPTDNISINPLHFNDNPFKLPNL